MTIPTPHAELTSAVPPPTSGHKGKQWRHYLRRGLLAVCISLGVLVVCGALLLRFALLPQVGAHRAEIEAALARELARPLTLQSISAHWQGMAPQFEIQGLTLLDSANRPALTLDKVYASVSWRSLWHWQLRLAHLIIDTPQLEMLRNQKGRIFIAGLEVSSDKGEGDFMPWLLAQQHITIRNATVTWRDEQRQAPILLLSKVNLDLQNEASRHRLVVDVEPPATVAKRLDLTVDALGNWPLAGTTETPAQVAQAILNHWQGRASAKFDALDVAQLSPWLSLPAQLQKARGNLQLRLEKNQADKFNIFADVDLQEVHSQVLSPEQTLDIASLKGQLELRQIDLQANSLADIQWHGNLHFTNANLRAYEHWPGFSNIAGQIEGGDSQGELTLRGVQAALDLPAVFAVARLPLHQIEAKLGWQRKADGMLKVNLLQSAFSNDDAAGVAQGSYTRQSQGPGLIDLAATLDRAAGNAVWRYIPKGVNADVPHWLQHSIISGMAEKTTLTLKGNLADFPFKDGKAGVFHIRSRFHEATLRYAENWPEISDIEGELLFEGARMRIMANKGKILGARLEDVQVELPDLESYEEILTVQGLAQGETNEFLKFIEKSPVGERLDHLTKTMETTGQGTLDLALTLPLRALQQTEVKGSYRFSGNNLVPYPGVPQLEKLAGQLQFTGKEVRADKISGILFNQPFSASIATEANGTVAIKSAGIFKVSAWQEHYPSPLLDHIDGLTPWTGVVRIKGRGVDARFESSLQGISSTLPAPLDKLAAENRTAVFRLQSGKLADELSLDIGNDVHGLISIDQSGEKRGIIAIGAKPLLPEQGMTLAVELPQFDLDSVLALIGDEENSATHAPLFDRIDIRAPVVRVFGRTLHQSLFSAFRRNHLWFARLDSREVAGLVSWDGTDLGHIRGNLDRLTLNMQSSADTASGKTLSEPDELPDMDLHIDQLIYNGKDFGSVNIRAEHDDADYWNVQMDINNSEGQLDIFGRWLAAQTGQETQIQFKLVAHDLEKLLTRMGFPQAMRNGKGLAQGRLSWRGTPFTPNESTLNGSFEFEVDNGQFKKLDPGVGRLLGVISLQSLPRRMSLDFLDVFSEGFAFDKITAQVNLSNGIARTNNLLMTSPAAKVFIAGTANIVAETQNLNVRVQPALGETLSTGAIFLVNPFAGGAAWALNKLLGNPLDQVFAFDYTITGAWADPFVAKVGTHVPALTAPLTPPALPSLNALPLVE